ncbi:MAG: response regulator [Hyphomonadaceae bacterium]|nr:response regulator [Hyphomonadaceae bacterium]
MRSHGSALVLEDSAPMRTMLCELLRTLKIEDVEAVASLGEAKAHLDYLTYDVALIDVGLGEENGLDLVRSIRRDRTHPARSMPFIVVSGQNLRGIVAAARDAGANAFVAKPVSAGALCQRVRAALEAQPQFVESETYFGPDRRRRIDPTYRGPERRQGNADDALYI